MASSSILNRPGVVVLTTTILIAILVGWALGSQNAAYAALPFVGVAILAIPIAANKFPIEVLLFSILVSILSDNFAGSLVFFADYLGFPFGAGEVIVISLSAAILLARMVSSTPGRLPKYAIGWAFWIVTLTQAALRAPDMHSSVRYWVQIGIIPIAIALTLCNLRLTWEKYVSLVKIITIIATTVATLALVERLIGHTLYSNSRRLGYLEDRNYFEINGLVRVGGVFAQPDWFGGFITLFLLLPVGLALTSRLYWGRIAWTMTALLLLVALTASGTRLSLIGAAVSIVASIGVGLCTGAVNVKLITSLTLGALFVGFIIVTSPNIFPLNQLNVVSTRLAPSDDETNLRIGGVVTGIDVSLAYPLTGVGLDYNHYTEVSAAYTDARQYRTLAHPHNSYVELAAFAGIPALISAVYLIAKHMVAISTHLRSSSRADPLRVAVFSSCFGFLVSNMFVNLLTLPAISYCFWVLLIATAQVDRENYSEG